jgi:hypothetical protein
MRHAGMQRIGHASGQLPDESALVMVFRTYKKIITRSL